MREILNFAVHRIIDGTKWMSFSQWMQIFHADRTFHRKSPNRSASTCTASLHCHKNASWRVMMTSVAIFPSVVISRTDAAYILWRKPVSCDLHLAAPNLLPVTRTLSPVSCVFDLTSILHNSMQSFGARKSEPAPVETLNAVSHSISVVWRVHMNNRKSTEKTKLWWNKFFEWFDSAFLSGHIPVWKNTYLHNHLSKFRVIVSMNMHNLQTYSDVYLHCAWKNPEFLCTCSYS